MARSFSNTKLVSAFLADRISIALTSCGYAVAAQGSVSGSMRGGEGMRSSVMMKKGVEEGSKTTPWVPDPETGYYRPENRGNEIDAADLREMLLNHKIRRH